LKIIFEKRQSFKICKLSKGKDTEALDILSWIYTKNTKKPSDQFAVKKLQPEYNQQNDLKPQKGW
jgi:hypothetical protein